MVTLHVPASEVTRELIGASAISQMKPGALLINTARGDLIDHAALLAAIASGRIGGAGLDVFPDEPHVDHGLASNPRVVTLPHIGSATTVTRRKMAELAVRNAVRVLDGQPPETPVVPAA